MKTSIREFSKEDIPNKLVWINDPNNHEFLHYDLPLEYNKTLKWYLSNVGNKSRLDCVIEVNNNPVGLIGLLSIDSKVGSAEVYIVVGNGSYRGKGVAKEAMNLILDYGFNELNLKKIYLHTEVENKSAQRLFSGLGFEKEELLVNDAINNGRLVDRYLYGITKKMYINRSLIDVKKYPIEIQKLFMKINENRIFMLRDDLLPFSFGGNKLRKSEYFMNEIIKSNHDMVLTYGSSSSNHVRVIANQAAKHGIPCTVIVPKEESYMTSNSYIANMFNIQKIITPISNVEKEINSTIARLKKDGFNPYFIEGGGHGNLGTKAYFDVFSMILDYEHQSGITIDYIFLASGTGTTQAGLICGNYNMKSEKKIIGISIARTTERGVTVIKKSIDDFLFENNIENNYGYDVTFIDDYIIDGYGTSNDKISEIVKKMMTFEGVPLDTTYTGKAFWGMCDYLKKCKVSNKNVLFIHTGGTPIFIDNLKKGEKND